eukprot:10493134-Lingulodinium_polyedra.AAC.1
MPWPGGKIWNGPRSSVAAGSRRAGAPGPPRPRRSMLHQPRPCRRRGPQNFDVQGGRGEGNGTFQIFLSWPR